jgi:hypothetical protein
MKIKSILYFTSLAVLATSLTNAGPLNRESAIITLPTYVVSAPRDLPFEKEMQENLRAACAQARTPIRVTSEAPFSKEQIRPGGLVSNFPAKKTAPTAKS